MTLKEFAKNVELDEDWGLNMIAYQLIQHKVDDKDILKLAAEYIQAEEAFERALNNSGVV